MRKLFIFIMGMLLTAQTFALEIKGVVDNESVSAKISSLDVTRILIQGDRIKSFKGITGAYTRENDKNNGEVYIQPTALYQTTPFTVLVETEQGRHFTLLLTPIGVPGGECAPGIVRRTVVKGYRCLCKRCVTFESEGATPLGCTVRDRSQDTGASLVRSEACVA